MAGARPLKTPPAWRSDQGDDSRILVGLDRAKYSTSPKGEEETTLWLWANSMEIAWRGSMLNVGLVLPRSRGFGDQQPSERSWPTSYVMVLGRRTCLGRWGIYTTSVAPYSECRGGLRDLRFMSRTSDATRSGDLDSLPSWISDHLGEGSSFMTDEVRLPDEGETIISTRPGEPSSFPTLGGALLALWHCGEYTNIPSPFPSLGTYSASIVILNRIKAGYTSRRGTRRFCSEDTPVMLRGGRASSSLSPATNGRFPKERLGRAPQEFRGRGELQISTAIILLDFTATNRRFLKRFFNQSRSRDVFSYPVLLDSKSYRRVFVSPDSKASRTAGGNIPSREAPSSSSDVGESQNPHEQARRESPSRDDSIECLGSIRTELRRLLPHIPDLTLLRWTGGNVLDPILDRFLNAPSSNPSSESCSDSSLPVELESEAMSKRVSFKKIGEKLGKNGGASLGTPVPAKGVMIGKKRAGESITSSPNKKGKADDGSKGKGVDSGSEGKKKATSSSKASAAPTAVPSRPGEGTSAYLGTILGPTPSILGSPSVAERLLRGVIPPADKEKVEKLTLDQTATKLFHVIGQQALVLGSSLAVCSMEAGEQASLQEGQVASMETEVARLQKFAADLEQQLAESRAREQEALDKAKESAVEEFKSLLEFMVAVEDFASKYFGEGFDFCKAQLRRHHPDLTIDLEGTVVDQDLLAEQDEAAEEREKENLGENKGSN
ncbi:hypothetical protein Acr_18g0007960 [Actinidia rufa]|uniref:Uncharacterized protein n=1 Tax=Actinidia rufa TaxID=165716 RepID=A0A7J0G764_9ERIC|nr:hypothetical protein Acr_18g0007960 [Actinidia rufa]